MQPLKIAGAYTWSVWQPDRAMSFNSYFFVLPDGNIAVDPLPLTSEDRDEVERFGGVDTIVITNRDHVRDAENLQAWSGARVACSATEAPLLPFQADVLLEDGDVHGGFQIVALGGAKTPGEIALVSGSGGFAVIGDAILGTPAGALDFLPAAKLGDVSQLALSLRVVAAARPECLLLCDGAPLFAGAHWALDELLFRYGGIAVNRVNVRDLKWIEDSGPDGRFTGEDAEIGFMIGARRLGYRLARLQPGGKYCPMHSHDLEEEFFYVLDGTPSIRTPNETLRLERGDFIAFPTGERGSHQLLNESDEPVTLLLVGNDEENDVAFYPDSKKVALSSRGLIVRSEPALDYFDGE